MTGAAAIAYLGRIQWQDEDFYLRDFIEKYPLPQVAKISRGQFMNLGESSSSLCQNVLLVESVRRIKIAAQCVKFKDNGRVVLIGSKLSIPDNYDGYFEILSEDGKAVRCIESVAELLRRFPETCLVREGIKSYLSKYDDVESISEKSRFIAAGETLALVGEVRVLSSKSKSHGRYLRCFTSRGESVFLSIDQRGKFSPIAGHENISGVHTIKNLVCKRFPLMVRLVHGKHPTVVKAGFSFVPEMRLYALFEEESIVALPLIKDSQIIALPPSAPLKVQAPKDPDCLAKLNVYGILAEKCKRIVGNDADKIQIFDISLSKELRNQKKGNGFPLKLQRSASDPNSKYNGNEDRLVEGPGEIQIRDPDSYDEIDQIYDYVRGFALPPPLKTIQVDTRGNGQSSPTSPKTIYSADAILDRRPEPPPVETIPVRRMSKEDSPPVKKSSKGLDKACETDNTELVEGHIYEKVRHRRDAKMPTSSRANCNGEKMFIPHHIHQGVQKILKGPAQNRIHHKSKYKQSRSSPALKATPLHDDESEWNTSKSLSTSPLFNIRYKSLMNLAVDFDTLDSSNSGGKTSNDSSGSKEKKTDGKHRLQRPKSLADIFGDQIDNKYKHRNFILNGLENRKFVFTHESVSGRLLNGNQNKRLGTLYL